MRTQQDIINENIIQQYEIRVQQDINKIKELKQDLVNALLERDELDEQYKKAVARFKDAEKRCAEMGTKNAECWDKINAHERTIERLEDGLKEAVALLRKVYDDVNTDAINISFEGGVLSEKIKDYLGV